MALGRLLMVETPTGLRRRAHGGDVVDLTTTEPLPRNIIDGMRRLPSVTGRIIRMSDRDMRLVVDDASTATPELINWCKQRRVHCAPCL